MSDWPNRRRRLFGPTTIAALLCVGGANSGGSSQTRGAHPVRIELPETVYESGDAVRFHIENSSPRTVRYRFGCERPRIYKLEDDGEVELTTNTDDSLPEIHTLQPNEVDTCQWEQRAWQDPKRRDRARFQHYEVLVSVPAGRYQIAVEYFLEGDANDNATRSVRSEIFTIR